ncbi:hypothetical protein [Lysobacter antibioticus]|uniref:hypothetical protein n=1 Tax=Lysobacter antibioticus TaxID=84531 RepID=UPI0011407468|nr:hypothetical protein [Lysobacter antibioticus]
MTEDDTRNLAGLRRLSEKVSAITAQSKANPRALDLMPIEELTGMQGMLRVWRPLMLSTARDMVNLEGYITKALKRRRGIRA